MKNKKPLWIALGAVAGIFLIAAVIALIVSVTGRGGHANRSAKEAPYPYSWVEKDGEISLTLTSKGLSGGSWTQASGTIVEVEAAEPKGGKTVMTITPLEPGREDLTFLLSDGSEVVAEATFTVDVVRAEDEQLSATVSAHRERALQGTLTGGTDGQYPFTITSENGSLLLKIVDPALVDALAESDEKQDGAKEFDEESPEEAGEEPSDDPDDEVFDETENEPGIMGGDTAIQEDQEGSEGDYYEVDYDEEANRPDPAEDETPTTFASDNWRISTTNSLVARPILAGIDTDGITYRIESDVNGEAVVTVYNSTAKVCYVFSLVARHGALSVSRYQVLDEISATTQEDLDQSLSGMGEIISGLQPYTPPPVPEEQEGEQDDGLGEQEQQAENEGSD